ncbi:PREDICTED: uncharacterized protein LOC101299926 [Fragaria vesca subsp. vesca]|uniref:uncharacterized protein LOC101299926 n=1 Tax=Fragaria vesca subsp. vesca TaxID=101020 RepID=UPI0002C2F5C5|nr:PREDICTED: uncharacterized protein LOC101299926 [Fragaria vesca subsp. vesca]
MSLGASRARGAGRAREAGGARGRGRAPPVDDFLEEEVVLEESVPAAVDDGLRLARLAQGIIRLGAPSFLGGTDFLVADHWIEGMETYFTLITCTEIEKMRIATFLLKDEARLFREKYFPDTVREQLELEFITLVQGLMSVRDYEARFSQLYRFAREMDAVALSRKFIRGLRHKLRNVVSSHRFATLAEVVESALAVEQEEAMHEAEGLRDVHGKGKAVAGGSGVEGHHGASGKRQRTDQQALATVPAAPIRQVEPLRCYRCDGLGHIARECHKRKTQACYSCGQVGHLARECTRPQEDRQGFQQRQLPPTQ